MIVNDFKKAVETANKCIACGSHAEYRGVYTPDDPGIPAPAEGTTRRVVYGICEEHIALAQAIGDQVQARFELEYGNNSIQ